MGVALVTGGAGGIGLATARRLRRDGYDVVVADVLDPPADLDATYVRCDLADVEPSLAALRAAVGDELSVLVNAAGIVERTSFGEHTEQEWERIYAVNTRAPLFVVQGLADLLHEGSAIVNVTSMEASHVVASTGRTTAIYASTKACAEESHGDPRRRARAARDPRQRGRAGPDRDPADARRCRPRRATGSTG